MQLIILCNSSGVCVCVRVASFRIRTVSSFHSRLGCCVVWTWHWQVIILPVHESVCVCVCVLYPCTRMHVWRQQRRWQPISMNEGHKLAVPITINVCYVFICTGHTIIQTRLEKQINLYCSCSWAKFQIKKSSEYWQFGAWLDFFTMKTESFALVNR